MENRLIPKMLVYPSFVVLVSFFNLLLFIVCFFLGLVYLLSVIEGQHAEAHLASVGGGPTGGWILGEGPVIRHSQMSPSRSPVFRTGPQ